MRYWSVCILLCLCFSAVLVWDSFVTEDEGVYVISVGQGDGAYISYQGRRFLIDVGKDEKVFSYINEMIKGVRFIDGIFISHNQYDHMGGLTRIMRTFPIGFIAFSSPPSDEVKHLCRLESIACIILSKGDLIESEGISIRVLWPPRNNAPYDRNEASLVLHVTLGDLRILFTGDITASVESTLVELYGEQLFSHVLKIPHHGSAYSSSPLFLKTVSPVVSVVSVGENTYGHPAGYVEDIIQEIGSALFRTDRDGTVFVGWEDDTLRVVTER